MTSVPAVASSPLAVTSATLRGVVGAVGVSPLMKSRALFSAVLVSASGIGLASSGGGGDRLRNDQAGSGPMFSSRSRNGYVVWA